MTKKAIYGHKKTGDLDFQFSNFYFLLWMGLVRRMCKRTPATHPSLILRRASRCPRCIGTCGTRGTRGAKRGGNPGRPGDFVNVGSGGLRRRASVRKSDTFVTPRFCKKIGYICAAALKIG